MATVASVEEIQSMIKKMDAYRQEIATNPKEAKRLLQAAGICTKRGSLRKPYRQ